MPSQKRQALINKYHKELKKYGYALIKLEDGRLVVQRMKPAKLAMEVSDTYKNIYDVSKIMVDEGVGILGVLLIGEVCRDAAKNPIIKKALVKSGYIEKYKDIVKSSMS